MVNYLLKRSVPTVSKRNDDDKLPVHLLCEAGEEKVARESLAYVESIWHLLLAYPETVSDCD